MASNRISKAIVKLDIKKSGASSGCELFAPTHVHLPWLGPVNFRDQPCANKVNPLSRHNYVLKKACFSIILRSFQFPSVSAQAAIILVRSFWAIILFFSFIFQFRQARSFQWAIILVGIVCTSPCKQHFGRPNFSQPTATLSKATLGSSSLRGV